jgi:hypothetical protein
MVAAANLDGAIAERADILLRRLARPRTAEPPARTRWIRKGKGAAFRTRR